MNEISKILNHNWFLKTGNFLVVEGLIAASNYFRGDILSFFIKGECPLPSPLPAFGPCADQYMHTFELFSGIIFWGYLALFLASKFVKLYKHAH